MPKISRPIVYSLLGAVVICAAVMNTGSQNTASTKKVTKGSAASAALLSSDVTQDDYKAKFKPYKSHNMDPFEPGVSKNSAFAEFMIGKGQWTLTGISVIDGVTSALIENESSGDSALLKTGDRWNGFTVQSVDQGSVCLANSSGVKITMAFANEEPESKETGKSLPPSLPAMPVNNNPVPAINFNNGAGGSPAIDNTTPARRGRGRRSYSTSSLMAVPIKKSKNSAKTIPALPPIQVNISGPVKTTATVKHNDAKEKSDS